MRSAVMRYVTNRKCQFWVVFGLLFLSIIPLLLIARYAHPSADDFSYGNHTVFTWRETNSLIQTISAAVEGTKHVYNTWQGSFVAVFFMTLHPGIFAEEIYMIGPIALILGFAVSNLLLLKVIFMNFLKADKYSYGIIASWFTFISMQFIFSPIEGFFWYNSALYYTGFHIASLFLFSVLLLSLKTEKTNAYAAYTVLTAIFSFLVGGSNFVTSLTSSVIMGLVLIYCVIWKRDRLLAPLLGFLIMCAALIISAVAPGNAIRQEYFQSMNPILAIVTSFEYGIVFVQLVIGAHVWVAFACVAPLLYKIAKNASIAFRYPGLVTAVLYGIYVSTFTPNLYSWSSFGPARVININYFAFLFFLLFSITYWCGWIARNPRVFAVFNKVKRARKKPPQKKQTISEKPSTALVCAVSLLAGVFLFMGVSMLINNPDSMMSASATRSLVTGEARAFHYEYMVRLGILRNPEISDAELPAFTVMPHVLFLPDAWPNTSMATFCGKNSVVIIDLP